MADIGGSLIGLHCAVKSCFFRWGSMSGRAFWYYIGCVNRGWAKPTLGLLPLSWIRDAR
ncbi:hypothetical protein KCP75_04800 [Salmonella enterica subsp. enterica]|nr:hypothetical protein KCP75_04800 [Salmonella enterica subsp. enterica]